MKIEIRKIPSGGLSQVEESNPAELDLDTDLIKFRGPIKIKAQISRITNVVTVHLDLAATLHASCSRCLCEFGSDFRKSLALNYPVKNSDLVIDLDPDIREETIIDYPIKPLCKSDCKGLCPKCGKNLNEEECICKVKSNLID